MTRTTSIVGVALLGALTLGLTACGSDTPTTTGTTAAAPTSAQTSAAAPATSASPTPTAASGPSIAPGDFAWPDPAGAWTIQLPASVTNNSSSARYTNGTAGALVKYDSVLLISYEDSVKAYQLQSPTTTDAATCGTTNAGAAGMCLAPVGQGMIALTMTSNVDLTGLATLTNALVAANS